MVNGGARPHEAVPEELERVRELLNTWSIPNDTRSPTDELDAVLAARGVGRADADLLRELRDDLRAVVEGGTQQEGRLDAWVVRLGVRPTVTAGRLGFVHGGGTAGDLLVAVLEAVVTGQWSRLKACGDCRWVFYDTTRNTSRRWCQMYAGGPDGRACGTIAKVRRYRARQATAAAAGPGGDGGPGADGETAASSTPDASGRPATRAPSGSSRSR